MTESASWIVKQITELSWKGGGNHDVDLGLRGQDFIWVGQAGAATRNIKECQSNVDLDIQSQYSRIDKKRSNLKKKYFIKAQVKVKVFLESSVSCK